MCGIFGLIGGEISQIMLAEISSSLTHRGPNGQIHWNDENCNLVHSRLEVLDLTNAASQPMHSDCGSYVIVYNGELYNYIAIKSELISHGITFTTKSDTEVVLKACIYWGLENALKFFDGMFAFGLYNKITCEISIARDHMGIKPLYYCINKNIFAFSSEIKQLRILATNSNNINIKAVTAYFHYGYIPSPYSIYENIFKLPSGTYITFRDGEFIEKKYFSIFNLYNSAFSKSNGSYASDLSSSVVDFHHSLKHVVAQQMQADVPVGVFLSGGIDSSLVAAIMQNISDSPINTFSLGFEDASIDESRHAALIAKYLGTNHSNLVIKAAELPNIIDDILNFCDEPFADNSLIPTFLVSKLAKTKVTVCLSGDGADELFAGYPRYFWANRIECMKKFNTICKLIGLHKLLLSKITRFITQIFDSITFFRFGGAEGLYKRVVNFVDYLTFDRRIIYSRKLSIWEDPSEIIKCDDSSIKVGPSVISYPSFTWADEMMMIDQEFFLQDDILRKLDIASMANSLEARVPFLSTSIIKLAWALPHDLKFSNKGDRGKIILRELLSLYIPRKLFERPKQGFGLPLGDWLRGPLFVWADNLLQVDLIEASGIKSEPVIKLWKMHLSGEEKQAKIWTLLVYIHWWRRNFKYLPAGEH